ncbi:MAG: ThuA domain-containing protein [Phycisphaerales bacterium]|nr:MAG: ThuA domain-containing protein [Phycisphaerales bacterium]
MTTTRLGTLSMLFLLATTAVTGTLLTAGSAAGADTLLMDARSRVEISDGGGKFRVLYTRAEWDPAETAIIICDMWDQHWCKGATRRVAELAPHMNDVVSRARRMGVLIIHAPSGTVGHYEEHPARKRAQEAPKASNLPDDIGSWRRWLDDNEEQVGYPIDHSDGGCDCQPMCKQSSAWSKQIGAIDMHDEDAISDSGVEIWNLLEQRGIKNLILMGVHTNMCVLGRPFGLRNMARFGKNVVLMRDMTDTMYNSRAKPFVNHFTGTDLIVEHIEKLVCPTITSTVLTGRPSFHFANDKRPRVVMISAESEYGAAETLPGFARELQMKYGLSCEILQGSIERSSADRHHISGMEELTNADLALVFVRRRAFEGGQMKYLRDYLDRGKPLIGLRTASHAFDTRGSAPAGHAEWLEFDHDVLGGNYHGHHGSGPTTTVTVAAGAEGHPILSGVRTPFLSKGSLYETRPLRETTKPLLIGTIPDKEPEPVAWTNTYKNARIFYTSLGYSGDFDDLQFRRMLLNAVFWAMAKPIPKP